jgi:cytochrome c oxidase subunit 1
MVLAGVLALLMLTLGGFGGMINASYSMNTMVHNTQWVTGHFHLIFAGTTVIMYFAIAYYLWPRMTGRQLYSRGLALRQLWLWFIGMTILTLPWHQLGIAGQPRRISSMPYDESLVQSWLPAGSLMVAGGAILLVSAVMLVYNLFRTHGNPRVQTRLAVEYAEPLHSIQRMPPLLNGFGFWVVLVLVYLVASYGYPIGQFFLLETYGTVPWSI